MQVRRAETAGQERLGKLVFLAWSCGPSCGLEGDVQSVLFIYFLKEICSWELLCLAIAWVQSFRMYGIEVAALFLSLTDSESK